MKCVRILFGILAAVLAAASVWVVANCRDDLPVLAAEPVEASVQVQKLMDALCDGAFEDMESLLYGQPDLGLDREAESQVGQMLWNAYISSLDYEMLGTLYATPTGLAQNVKVISMEMETVTENLGQRVQILVQQGVEAAESVSEIYNEENTYKQSFIDMVMEEAVRQALDEDVRYTYRIVPVQLVFREGQWWIQPDKVLLEVVSGGTAG